MCKLTALAAGERPLGSLRTVTEGVAFATGECVAVCVRKPQQPMLCANSRHALAKGECGRAVAPEGRNKDRPCSLHITRP